MNTSIATRIRWALGAAVTMIGLSIIGAPTASSVGPLTYKAALAGADENPPVATSAYGTATVALTADETHMTVQVTYYGLSAGSTASHIHKAAVGVNGPVQVPLPGPIGVTYGTFGVTDYAVTPAQVADLRAGLWYVNVHSTNFPAGEIRGQLVAVTGSEARCRGQIATNVGTEGADILTGTAGPDVFMGLGGNDTVVGLGGNDLLCGGDGDDNLQGGSGNDKIWGDAGNDFMKGGAGTSDVCKGGPGLDKARRCEKARNL